MRARHGWIAAGALACVLGAGFCYQWLGAQGGANPPPQFSGAAIHIVPKGANVGYFLKDPVIRIVGHESFAVGAPIQLGNARNGAVPIKMWVPLSNLSHIEEFDSVKTLQKAYPVDE
jgi:hypothetical protein